MLGVPKPVLHAIATSYGLSLADVGHLACVCRRFRQLFGRHEDADVMWHAMARRAGMLGSVGRIEAGPCMYHDLVHLCVTGSHRQLWPYLLLLHVELCVDEQGRPLQPPEAVYVRMSVVSVEPGSRLYPDEFMSFVKPVTHPQLSRYLVRKKHVAPQAVNRAPMLHQVLRQASAWLRERGYMQFHSNTHEWVPRFGVVTWNSLGITTLIRQTLRGAMRDVVAPRTTYEQKQRRVAGKSRSKGNRKGKNRRVSRAHYAEGRRERHDSACMTTPGAALASYVPPQPERSFLLPPDAEDDAADAGTEDPATGQRGATDAIVGQSEGSMGGKGAAEGEEEEGEDNCEWSWLRSWIALKSLLHSRGMLAPREHRVSIMARNLNVTISRTAETKAGSDAKRTLLILQHLIRQVGLTLTHNREFDAQSG